MEWKDGMQQLLSELLSEAQPKLVFQAPSLIEQQKRLLTSSEKRGERERAGGMKTRGSGTHSVWEKTKKSKTGMYKAFPGYFNLKHQA